MTLDALLAQMSSAPATPTQDHFTKAADVWRAYFNDEISMIKRDAILNGMRARLSRTNSGSTKEATMR